MTEDPLASSPALDAPPALRTPARAAMWRAVVACAALAVALPLVSVRGLGGWRLNALLGLGLGLVVGALTIAEHLARRRQLGPALAWAALIVVVGQLAVGAQVGFAERVFTGGHDGALEDMHRSLWLVLYDPLTLPLLALHGVALAVPPLARCLGGRRGWIAGSVAAALGGALAVLALREARGFYLDVGHMFQAYGVPRFGLPLGPELRPGSDDRDFGPEVLRAALALLLVSAASGELGDRLARRFATGAPDDDAADDEPADRRLGLLGPAVPAACLAAALAYVGGRAPFVGHLRWLLEGEPFSTQRLRDRVGPVDAQLLPVLTAALTDPSGPSRWTVLGLIDRIGPPLPADTVAAVESAVHDPDPDVAGAALQLLRRAGDDPSRRSLLRLFREKILAGASSRPLQEIGYGPGYSSEDREVVQQLTRDPDPVVAITALGAVAAWHDGEEALQRLEEHLGDPDPALRDLAARAIADAGNPGLEYLSRRLEVPGAPAHRVLPFLDAWSSHTRFIQGAARSPDPALARVAAQALRADGPAGRRERGPEVLVELIVEGRSDDLVDALATYGPSGTQALVDRLGSEQDPEVRRRLERALRLLGH